MFRHLNCRSLGLSLALSFALSGSFGVAAYAQSLDQDFEFASKLVENGFPDFANKLMENVVRRYPDQAGRAKIINAEAFIAARKFSDAEALVKQMPAGDPKADAIQLAIANGYYRIGEIDRSRQMYQDFFNRFQQAPGDPDLLKFYRDAAYRFSQMLHLSGDLRGAANAIGRVLASNPDTEVARSMKAEQAQMLVDAATKTPGGDRDKLLNLAESICKDIQWGGADLWFGQSIVTMANIELLRGNRETAEKMLTLQYADILQEIGALIKEQKVSNALNPLAGSRFLLGEMYQHDADQALQDPARRDEAIALYAKALKEFYNVFVKYGDSDRGPEAGVRANAVKGQLESLGKTVKINLGEGQAEQAAATQFRLADNLYRQHEYPGAITEYLRALNAYPETAASIRSLGFLVQSYLETGDQLTARALAGYAAERFAGKPDAATAVLSAAATANSKKDEALATDLYELYLKYFPNHERAGTILFYLGGQRSKAGDSEGANYYFQRIVDNYPKDQYYPQALRVLAASASSLGNFDQAIAAYTRLVHDIPPSPDRASAQFSLADSYVRQTNWAKAAAEFETLMGWLAPKENPYATTEEERTKNHSILERATFQRALAYSRITEPAAGVASFRERGMRGYQQFLKFFPESDLAPRAMMGEGQILLSLNQFDAAAKTFDQLAERYPDSEQGKNALYSLASSAMEIGQYDQARMAFEKMAANAGAYKPEEFTRIGQLMIDAKLYDEALQAFKIVSDNPRIRETKDTPESRSLLERALFGVGRANFERKNYEDAVTALESLLKEYPRTAYFFDTRFMLGGAYAELGNLRAASESLGEIFNFSKDTGQRNKASMKLAELQLKAGDKSGALASYQRVAFLSDPNKADLRPYIHQALLASVPLAMELKLYKDAVESCEQFLKLYPTSDKVSEVRRWRSEASLQAGVTGGTGAGGSP